MVKICYYDYMLQIKLNLCIMGDGKIFKKEKFADFRRLPLGVSAFDAPTSGCPISKKFLVIKFPAGAESGMM